MKNQKTRKWKVRFSNEVLRDFKNLPDDVSEEFEKIIVGFKTGEIDPLELGKQIDYHNLDIKLKCPDCNSNNVEWLLDKNSDEVDFNCFKCSKSFWMTYEEYKESIRKNQDKIV